MGSHATASLRVPEASRRLVQQDVEDTRIARIAVNIRAGRGHRTDVEREPTSGRLCSQLICTPTATQSREYRRHKHSAHCDRVSIALIAVSRETTAVHSSLDCQRTDTRTTLLT